jgi:hypothetical protein
MTAHMARNPHEYECRASKILSRVLCGEVVWRDVRGAPSGTHDFDLKLADGKTIAVEVTSFTDENAQAFWRAVSKKRWRTSELSKSWVLDVCPTARVRTLRDQVEQHLRVLEKTSVPEFGSSGSSDPTICALRQLGVKRGRSYEWTPPCIYICSSSGGGSYSPEDLRPAVEGVAWVCDNRQKLGRAAGAERHLFIWIDVFAHAVAASLWSMHLRPPGGCCLPPEVNVLWVATPTANDEVPILWRFDRSGGWQRVPLGQTLLS